MGLNTHIGTATILTTFITASNSFEIRTDTSGQFQDNMTRAAFGDVTEGLISFQTTNDMKDDAAGFRLVLASNNGTKWDRVLSPNDIVTIQVNPGHDVDNDYIMVGLVDTVRKIGSYNEDSLLYQIEGKSMMKALMQIKLGTIQEAMSLLGSTGWMMGMGGLRAANSDESSSGDSSSSDKEDDDKKEESEDSKDESKEESKDDDKVIGPPAPASETWVPNDGDDKWDPHPDGGKEVKLKVKAISKKEMFMLIGEKSQKPVAPDSSGTLIMVNPGVGIMDGQEVKVPGYGTGKATVTVSGVGAGGKLPADVVVLYAKDKDKNQFNAKYEGEQSIVLDPSNAKKPDAESGKKDGEGEGEGGESTGTGLMLGGKTARDVVEQLINWFLNLEGIGTDLQTKENGESVIKYEYADPSRPKLSNYLSTNLSSRTEDEQLTDPTPIMSFTGSLRKLIDEAAAKPYNEVYNEFTPDGKMSIIMRPTPFEPGEWNALKDKAVILNADDVIEESTSQSDVEAFSIFSSAMPSSVLVSGLNSLMMYPVYYPALAERYGYSMLQQENGYIFLTKPAANSTGGGSESSGDSYDTSSVGAGSAETEANAKAIAAYLKKEGFKGAGIAGLLGNFHRESYINPGLNEFGNGIGYGIAQWSYTRRTDLEAYAKKKGKPVNDLSLQIDFMLNGEGATSDLIKGIMMGPGNVEQMTTEILQRWEVADPAVADLPGRIKFAKHWYTTLGLDSYTPGKGNVIGPSLAASELDAALDAARNNTGGGSGKSKDMKDVMNDIDKSKGKNGADKILEDAKNPKPSKDINEAIKDAESNKGGGGTGNPIGPMPPKDGDFQDGSWLQTEEMMEKTDSVLQGQADSKNIALSKKYSVMLANWYGLNPSFLSGDIRVIGSPEYRIGEVLHRRDPGEADLDVSNPEENPSVIEYYIEGVSHEFNFEAGYTTTLHVTRGLPTGMTRIPSEGGDAEVVDRFRFWNDPVAAAGDMSSLTADNPGAGDLQLFFGGLFGEMTIGSAAKYAEQHGDSDGNSSSSSGGGPTSNAAGEDGATASSGTNTYPDHYKNAPRDTINDEWGYLNRECTSYAAHKLSLDSKNSGYTHLGHAISWGTAGEPHSNPKPGDVAYFGAGSWSGGVSGYGHVGFVDEVKGDTIIMSDYNYGDPGWLYHVHKLDKNVPTKYLRFH